MLIIYMFMYMFNNITKTSQVHKWFTFMLITSSLLKKWYHCANTQSYNTVRPNECKMTKTLRVAFKCPHIAATL